VGQIALLHKSQIFWRGLTLQHSPMAPLHLKAVCCIRCSRWRWGGCRALVAQLYKYRNCILCSCNHGFSDESTIRMYIKLVVVLIQATAMQNADPVWNDLSHCWIDLLVNFDVNTPQIGARGSCGWDRYVVAVCRDRPGLRLVTLLAECSSEIKYW